MTNDFSPWWCRINKLIVAPPIHSRFHRFIRAYDLRFAHWKTKARRRLLSRFIHSVLGKMSDLVFLNMSPES